MAFLIKKDFEKHIQKDNLDQILGGNDFYLDECILLAIAEATSYLAQRYYISKIFRSVDPFSLTKPYRVGDVIWGSHTQWLDSVTYTLDAIIAYQGKVYRKNNDFDAYVAGILPTTNQYFEYLYENETIYSHVGTLTTINDYDHNKTYEGGSDVVRYYFDYFTCIVNSYRNHPTIQNFWIPNDYSQGPGNPPQNIYSGWIKGDTRNPQLKTCLIDIALYHLHSRINPRNIPELRKERYDGNSPEQKGGAIGWLKNVAHGLVNADLPETFPFQLPISWGSYEKQNNNF